MAHERRDWPVVSLAEAYRVLTAPGAPFEMETIDAEMVPARAVGTSAMPPIEDAPGSYVRVRA